MLTSKQRAYLRGIANNYDTLFQVGKDGVSDNIIIQVNDALEARELIKLNSLENCPIEPKEIAAEIAEKANCDVVQVIGRRIIFYKESKNNKKIILPKSK